MTLVIFFFKYIYSNYHVHAYAYNESQRQELESQETKPLNSLLPSITSLALSFLNPNPMRPSVV